jgi:hypothetical protein
MVGFVGNGSIVVSQFNSTQQLDWASVSSGSVVVSQGSNGGLLWAFWAVGSGVDSGIGRQWLAVVLYRIVSCVDVVGV